MATMIQPAQVVAPQSWQDWDDFVEAHPRTGFMQSSWWAEFRTAAGFEYETVIARDGHTIIGGAMVYEYSPADSCSYYYIPEGPVLPSERTPAREVLSALLKTLDEERRETNKVISHLRIEPRWTALPGFVHGFRPVANFADPFMEPRDTLCVDLREGQDTVLANMKPKGRYNIRLAARHGVVVSEDPSQTGIRDFAAMYAETAARQNMASKPDEYFNQLVSMARSMDRGTIFFAECGGERIAAAVVIWFGRRATYLFGASRDVMRHVMAPYALHYEIMRRAMIRGCTWYDFWGIAPSDAEDHPWSGITAFKRKFGGDEVNLVPTLDLVYDSDAYAHYQAAYHA